MSLRSPTRADRKGHHQGALRRLMLACVALTAVTRLPAQTPVATFDSVFRNTRSAISSLAPQGEGSPAEAAAFADIQSTLSGYNLRIEAGDFSEFDGGHSFSQSIGVEIAGALQDELIIAIPMHIDDATPAAGAPRIALGVALAAALSEMALPLSVRVLFLGAEYGDGERYPMGTRQFLDGYFAQHDAVVFYLDFDRFPERTVVRAGAGGSVSPYWLIESCSQALDAAGIYYLVRGNETQFYRLGLSVNPAPLEPYLSDKIPGVSFHGEGASIPQSEELAWAQRCFEFVLGFIIDNDRGYPVAWDRHYLFFQIRSVSTIIREGVYIGLILAILSIILLYPLAVPDRFRNYARSVARYFWAVPALIGLVTLLLVLGTLIGQGVMRIQRNPELWTLKPALFFGLKLSTAVFLFALLFRYVKRIPFPRRGRFYNAVALLMLFLDILVLGAFDISLAYYVVWATLWCFLFSLSSSRWVKILCLLAAPLWFAKALYDVFSLPELNIARLMILSPLEGNIILAVIMLPFLCMLIRLDFMFRHPRKRTRRVLMTAVYLTLGIGVGVLFVYLSLFNAYGTGHVRPLTATERVDLNTGNARLRLETPNPLGLVTLKIADETSVLDLDANSYELSVPADPSLLKTEIRVSRFLGRGELTVTVDARRALDTISIDLRSDDELVVLDTNFPLSYRSFREAEIHVGRNPPLPLTISVTVPERQTGTLTIVGTYRVPPTDLSIAAPNTRVTRTLEVSKRFDLDEIIRPPNSP